MHIDETIPYDSDGDSDFLPESNSESYSDTDQSEKSINKEDIEEDESILEERLKRTNNLSDVEIRREGKNTEEDQNNATNKEKESVNLSTEKQKIIRKKFAKKIRRYSNPQTRPKFEIPCKKVLSVQ